LASSREGGESARGKTGRLVCPEIVHTLLGRSMNKEQSLITDKRRDARPSGGRSDLRKGQGQTNKDGQDPDWGREKEKKTENQATSQQTLNQEAPTKSSSSSCITIPVNRTAQPCQNRKDVMGKGVGDKEGKLSKQACKRQKERKYRRIGQGEGFPDTLENANIERDSCNKRKFSTTIKLGLPRGENTKRKENRENRGKSPSSMSQGE